LQNVLVSAGVELALVAASAFLMLSTRRMQRLADQKMQFVAGVSHELRTPVSSIAVLSRNQADGLVTGPDQVRQYGELIYQQSRRLGDMVEQTLALSGIQSGRRQPAFCSVDIRALVEEAVAVRREALARAGFDLEVDFQESLPAVHGDPRLLSTAVANLLSNAEKYANGSRWIRVAAESDPDGKEVRIHVEDHGSGIDAADRSHIFEPFYRGGGAVEAQVPGSGIGLSLVRATAEAHQGSVTFVTEPGRGSKFTLHLPARTSDAQ
jgi:signal transduction histidine kinase